MPPTFLTARLLNQRPVAGPHTCLHFVVAISLGVAEALRSANPTFSYTSTTMSTGTTQAISAVFVTRVVSTVFWQPVVLLCC